MVKLWNDQVFLVTDQESFMRKSVLWNFVLGSLVALGSLGNLLAAPLELKQVPGDAKWVVHVDFDAIRASTVVQRLHKLVVAKHPGAEVMCNTMKALSGIDPRHDLHGATFFGNQLVPHQGTLILHASMDKAKITSLGEKLPHREVSQHGDRSLTTWHHEHHGRKHTASAAFSDDSHLIMSSSPEDLRNGLDVLDGKAPAVGPDSPLAGGVPQGTTVLLRVHGINQAELPAKLKLAKQTESYRFVMGEFEGKSFFRSRSVMTNPEVVGQLSRAIDGFKALAELHAGNDEVGKRLVDGLRVKTQEKTLTVLWSGSADDVWKMFELHRKHFEAHRAKMHHRRGGAHRDRKPAPPQPNAEEDF